MIIDGYRTYLYYQSLKLHFSKKDFDAIKNHGRIKIPKQRYLSRNDKSFFELIAKKLKDDHTIADFMIANFVSGNSDFIYNYDRSFSEYLSWKERKESLSYVFANEAKKLEDSLLTSKNVYMCLLRNLVNKNISPETFIALDNFYDIFKSYTQEFLWSEYEILLTKYKPFVKIKEQHRQHFLILEKFLYERYTAKEQQTV